MNITDIILVLIIVFVAFVGATKGFFRSLAGVASYVIAVLVAKTAATPIADNIYQSVIRAKILMELDRIFASGSLQGEITASIQTMVDSLPSYLGSLIKYFSPRLGDNVNNIMTVAQFESEFISPIVQKALSWAAAILLFILCSIILKIVFGAINRLLFGKRGDGFLSGFNKLLGFLLGTVKGAALVLASCLILNLLAPIIGEGAFADSIKSSAICGFISQLF